MDYELPSEFDLVIIGTGVLESIISAAASRVGKTVLQIDTDANYGGQWASYNLESIQTFNKSLTPETTYDPSKVAIAASEEVLSLGNEKFAIKDVVQSWNIPEEVNGDDDKAFSRNDMLKKARRFNIDLCPKLQYARGDFVELLISSNIARYSEYRSVSRVLAFVDGQLEVVPCSRSDVFSNDKVSVIEKRLLMKLLTACMDGDVKEFSGYENTTFLSFLKDKKLTPNLIQYILYALAMSTDTTSFTEGSDNLKRFLTSLGRFGKTPFLYSLYGSGEIPQAFCRLSAVFGGVYALNQSINGLIFDADQNYQAIIAGNQRINSKYLVTSVEKCPKDLISSIEPSAYISRAIFLLDKSILKSDKEHLSLLIMPTEDKESICYIIEAGSATGTCIESTFMLHMFMKYKDGPEADLQQFIDKLISQTEDAPKILWSLYFAVPDSNGVDLKSGVPGNVHLCPGPDFDLDYDSTIKKAKEIFKTIYPDDEFLPRAPDPEEIIIGADEADEESNSITAGEEAEETGAGDA